MAKQVASVLLLSLLVAIDPGPLPAQNAQNRPDVLDMSLEELMKLKIDSVWGASKYNQKVTDAPASITIVTADEIKKIGRAHV